MDMSVTDSQSIPCTAQVLTRNNAEGIRACLDSLGAFAEVIVQDGFSTDGTRETAEHYPNVRLMDQNPAFLDRDGRITDFSAMRNVSIMAAKHDWVFVVDGDERVDPELVEEIRAIVEANEPGVYQAFRRFYLGDVPVVFCAGYPAYQIRLFHRSLTEGYKKSVHERLVLKSGVIARVLEHELPVPLPPVGSQRPKFERYLAMEVKRIGVTSWGHWLRWALYRNLRSVAGILARVLWLRMLPKKGLRMPLSYELAHVSQSLRVIVRTCPPVACHWLGRNG